MGVGLSTASGSPACRLASLASVSMMAAVELLTWTHWRPCIRCLLGTFALAGLLLQALWQRDVAVGAVAVATGELLSWPLACQSCAVLARLAVVPCRVGSRRCVCCPMFHCACSSLRGSVCNVLLEWPTPAGRPDCPLVLHACGVGSIRCSFASWRWLLGSSLSVLLTCWPLGPGLPLVLRALRVGSDVSPCANSCVCVGRFSPGDR